MTPELKISCEIVFQEHKASAHPITWTRNSFHGRMSIGLREMAKETLVQKKIILFPKPAKKTVTVLNPSVATASTFEEAALMAQSKIPVLVSLPELHEEEPAYEEPPVTEKNNYTRIATGHISQNSGNMEAAMSEEKWYLKPVFYYVIWPISAGILSILIAYLLSAFVEMSHRG